MLSVFSYAFNAIASIFLVSVFGYAVKQTGCIDDAFTGKMNSLFFRYFLSINLFISIYNIDSLRALPLPQMLYCAFFITLMFVIGLVVSRYLSPDNRQRSVLMQVTFRSNAAVVGLSLAKLLGGEEAEQVAAMFISSSVMLFNIYAVACFSIYAPGAEHKRIDKKQLLINITRNPLIRGLSAGLLCLFLRMVLPKNAQGHPIVSLRYTLPPLYNALGRISNTASPVLLFLLGARFDFSAVKSLRKQIVAGVLLRNIAAPIIGYGCLYLCANVLHLFPAPPVMYQAMIGIIAAPCAVSAAVMAAEMGGDDTLAGQLVVWSSLFSVFSLFLLITTLRMLHLI